MKDITLLLSLALFIFSAKSQEVDTFYLYKPVSKSKTIIYKRIIQFDKTDSLYHVLDCYPSGQILMKGTYSSFDKNVKENYWCNYRTNTKQGLYHTWYNNGQLESRCNLLIVNFRAKWRNGIQIGKIAVVISG